MGTLAAKKSVTSALVLSNQREVQYGADHSSGIFQKRDEEPIRLILQLYAESILQEFAGAGIDFKRAKLVDSSVT